MALGLRTGDKVIVIAGRAKGKTGKLLKIFHDSNRALVEKVNMVKKNSKPTQKNPQGGIIEKEASIHLSNLMLYSDSKGKGSRFGIKSLKDGRRVRFLKKTDEMVDKK